MIRTALTFALMATMAFAQTNATQAAKPRSKPPADCRDVFEPQRKRTCRLSQMFARQALVMAQSMLDMGRAYGNAQSWSGRPDEGMGEMYQAEGNGIKKALDDQLEQLETFQDGMTGGDMKLLEMLKTGHLLLSWWSSRMHHKRGVDCILDIKGTIRSGEWKEDGRCTVPEDGPDESQTVAAPPPTISMLQPADLYKTKCQACHGPEGTGATVMGKTLGAHDFHSPEVQKMTEAQVIEVITKGKEKMPAYGAGNLTAAQIKELAGYVHKLGSKK